MFSTALLIGWICESRCVGLEDISKLEALDPNY